MDNLFADAGVFTIGAVERGIFVLPAGGRWVVPTFDAMVVKMPPLSLGQL
jgi:hypothetical protein